jgi:hypothetical protein
VAFVEKHTDGTSAEGMHLLLLERAFFILPGLPDGIFSNQIFQFGYILEDLRREM